MSDPTLFDAPPARPVVTVNAARLAADEAVERVGEHADGAWMLAAERIVAGWPSGQLFTTDDLWRFLLAAGVETHERRAMGAVVRRLATSGAIRSTGQYRPSTRVECHGRPILIWRRT